MCGRYSLTTPVEGLRQVFGFLERPNLAPRYNVAPSQDIAAVRLGEDGERHFAQLRWGLIPSWAKEAKIGYKMINARAETVAEKPAFRAAFKKRRCLILADGFYEWQKQAAGPKQPYRIARRDGAAFAFAGLWERWRNPAPWASSSASWRTTRPRWCRPTRPASSASSATSRPCPTSRRAWARA